MTKFLNFHTISLNFKFLKFLEHSAVWMWKIGIRVIFCFLFISAIFSITIQTHSAEVLESARSNDASPKVSTTSPK